MATTDKDLERDELLSLKGKIKDSTLAAIMEVFESLPEEDYCDGDISDCIEDDDHHPLRSAADSEAHLAMLAKPIKELEGLDMKKAMKDFERLSNNATTKLCE